MADPGNRAATPGHPRFPYPGTEAFAALSAEEQAWVSWVRAWYVRGSSLGSPSLVMNHPAVEEFRAHPGRHLPMLLKYFLASPRLMDQALQEVTGQAFDVPTAEEAQKAWAAFLPGYLASHAAE